ncbi:MAG: hypothetical protein ABR497_05395 [Kiritimatiellia bacterium]
MIYIQIQVEILRTYGQIHDGLGREQDVIRVFQMARVLEDGK